MIGIYGGSFDPPHLGHLGVMKSFWKEYPECKKLLLVPNYISPFKKSKGTKVEHILNMLNLLVEEANLDRTQIEEFEIQKQNTSYTIETVEFLKELYKAEEFYMLLGVDNLKGFPNWKGYISILESCKIIIFDREWDKSKIMPKELKLFWDRLIFLENPPIYASSSEIRDLKAENRSKSLSPKIYSYIKENELYGFRKGD